MNAARCFSLLLVLFSLFGLAATVQAQPFPSKPIRLIVPLAPGTGTDQVSRALAQKLTETLGQQVYVENRGGAGATIGTEVAARSAPNGYTLYMGGSVALTISPALYRKVPYDAVKDFTPISLISRFYLVLSGHPSLPVRNIKELIALARKRPGEMIIGSGGSGTTSHLTAALLINMAGVNLLHVPYKGGGNSLIAIMSGESQLAFTPVVLAQQQVKSGKLRLLGVTSAKRIAPLPEVPAITETVPGYEWSGWQVLMVPAGTPADVVKQLQAAAQSALGSPEFRGHLEREGSEPFQVPVSEFPQFLRGEVAKNAKLVQISGARVD
jgi:tripartite-type tricarboxylate transporter receptor subunit TctC